ncbi:MAG: hypothetical protein ISR69_11365 [Gammaproteobacteria bacterium]|nr:hypothetical protein [Gammaproteobacteria bacterium]
MSISQAQVEKMHEALCVQNKALHDINTFGKSRKTTTNKIIRSISIILFILLVINLFIMFQLNKHLGDFVSQIDQMKTSFAEVAITVNDINNEVDDVNKLMQAIPNIDTSMTSISIDMPNIASNMMRITTDINRVDLTLSTINTKMLTINQKMVFMGANTQRLQYDIRNIAKPTKFFNWLP